MIVNFNVMLMTKECALTMMMFFVGRVTLFGLIMNCQGGGDDENYEQMIYDDEGSDEHDDDDDADDIVKC